MHPHYNVSLTDTVHDIAIVKLSQPLNFESESVRPACVLQENEGGRMKDYGEVISTGKVLFLLFCLISDFSKAPLLAPFLFI